MSELKAEGIVAGHGAMTVLHGVDLTVPAGSTTAIPARPGAARPLCCGSSPASIARMPVASWSRTATSSAPVSTSRPSTAAWGMSPKRAPFPTPERRRQHHLRLRRGDPGRATRLTELLDLVGLPARSPADPPTSSPVDSSSAWRWPAHWPAAHGWCCSMSPSPPSTPAYGPALAEPSPTHRRRRGDRAHGDPRPGRGPSFADQIVVMDAGRILQAGITARRLPAPADRVTAGFLGDLVTVVGRAHDGRVESALGTHATDSAAEGAVEVALRPEQIVLHSADEPGIRTEAVGTVRHCDYFGHDALVHVALDDGSEIAARLGAGGQVPRTGERVTASVTGSVLTYPCDPTAAHAPRSGAPQPASRGEQNAGRLPSSPRFALAGRSTGGADWRGGRAEQVGAAGQWARSRHHGSSGGGSLRIDALTGAWHDDRHLVALGPTSSRSTGSAHGWKARLKVAQCTGSNRPPRTSRWVATPCSGRMWMVGHPLS